MNKKKVLLYYPWVYLKGGAERLIINIVTNSRHDWRIYTNHYDSENTFPGFKELKITEISRVSVRREYSAVGKASLKILTQKVELNEFDTVLIINEGIGSFFNFRNHGKPIICVCLTPLKVIHDPFTKTHYLRTHRFAFLKFFIFGVIFKIVDKFAWSYYKQVICISEEVKRRVLKARLAKNDIIEVLYPGINLKNKKPNWVYEKYFLIPGRIMWQKNIELGIESFKKFCIENPGSEFKLVIAGMVDEKSKTYLDKLLKLASDSENIQFILSPPDEKLFELYRNCYSAIFTSPNEDWGMVILEAMAYGKPVICVNRGGPNESVIDGKTGFLVNPEADDFAEKMSFLVNDKEKTQKMGQEAIKYIGQFSLSNFIDRLDEIIDKI